MTETSVDLEILVRGAKRPAPLDLRLASGIDALERVNENCAGWALNLFEEAGEASGSFRSSAKPALIPARGEGREKARSQEEASRRARFQIRRYCAYNRLQRLSTLNFGGEGCHDPRQLRTYLSAFFVELRKSVGRDFPYLCVPEWHPGGHGLRVRFAVGRYIKKGLLDDLRTHGWVHIKVLGDLPHGSQD